LRADLHIDHIFYWVGDGKPLPELICLRGLSAPFEVYYDGHLIGSCETFQETPKLDPFGPAPEFGPTILSVELDLPRLFRESQ
jgi:hypothetical protein